VLIDFRAVALTPFTPGSLGAAVMGGSQRRGVLMAWFRVNMGESW